MRQLLKLCLIPFLLLFLSAGLQAQTRTVRGKVVTEDDNQPIVGASVLVKGATVGTATDAAGSFSLNVPEGRVTLVVSYVGFSLIERSVDANTSTVSITLSPSGR